MFCTAGIFGKNIFTILVPVWRPVQGGWVRQRRPAERPDGNDRRDGEDLPLSGGGRHLLHRNWSFLEFFQMCRSRPLFVYFCYFLNTISIIQIEKSIDGVLGIWTPGRRMVGADKTTELWRPPWSFLEFKLFIFYERIYLVILFCVRNSRMIIFYSMMGFQVKSILF